LYRWTCSTFFNPKQHGRKGLWKVVRQNVGPLSKNSHLRPIARGAAHFPQSSIHPKGVGIQLGLFLPPVFNTEGLIFAVSEQ